MVKLRPSDVVIAMKAPPGVVNWFRARHPDGTAAGLRRVHQRIADNAIRFEVATDDFRNGHECAPWILRLPYFPCVCPRIDDRDLCNWDYRNYGKLPSLRFA